LNIFYLNFENQVIHLLLGRLNTVTTYTREKKGLQKKLIIKK